MSRAVALFSGGLDSALSVRILQEQHFEVEALNIRTIYSCSQAAAAQAAAAMGIKMTTLDVDDDYLEVIRNPLYGYGKGVNPCIDCRIYMCRMAKRPTDGTSRRLRGNYWRGPRTTADEPAAATPGSDCSPLRLGRSIAAAALSQTASADDP